MFKIARLLGESTQKRLRRERCQNGGPGCFTRYLITFLTMEDGSYETVTLLNFVIFFHISLELCSSLKYQLCLSISSRFR